MLLLLLLLLLLVAQTKPTMTSNHTAHLAASSINSVRVDRPAGFACLYDTDMCLPCLVSKLRQCMCVPRGGRCGAWTRAIGVS